MNNIDQQFIEHRKAFRAYIFYNCGFNNELADDLTQDLYIKIRLQTAKGKYEERGKFRAWGLWVARNMLVDYFRKENRSATFVIDKDEYVFILDASKETDDSIEDKIIDDETFTWLLEGVERAIEQLDDLQRKTFLMRVIENKSFKDIIQLTGESQNTELGRYRYARLNILKKLREYKILT